MVESAVIAEVPCLCLGLESACQGWSSAKQSWCCAHESRGCPGTWAGHGLTRAVVTHVTTGHGYTSPDVVHVHHYHHYTAGGGYSGGSYHSGSYHASGGYSHSYGGSGSFSSSHSFGGSGSFSSSHSSGEFSGHGGFSSGSGVGACGVGHAHQCPDEWQQPGNEGGFHCLHKLARQTSQAAYEASGGACRPASEGQFPEEDCQVQCRIGGAH